jgi:hypothetical protein
VVVLYTIQGGGEAWQRSAVFGRLRAA